MNRRMTHERDKIPLKEILMSLAFPAGSGVVAFLLPSAYVATSVGDRYVISSDFGGVFILTVLTLTVSFLEYRYFWAFMFFSVN